MLFSRPSTCRTGQTAREMIEVIAALIRWLAFASCSIMTRGHDDAVRRVGNVSRALFSDNDPAAKHHTPVP